MFFKLCKLNGIAYDSKAKLGTLFFLADSIVGGVISILCIGSTRAKALEMAAGVLSFISNNFGRDRLEAERPWNDLTAIMLRIRAVLKRERARDKHALRKETAGAALLDDGR